MTFNSAHSNPGKKMLNGLFAGFLLKKTNMFYLVAGIKKKPDLY